MFNQWRHAVENLAQSPRSSQDAPSSEDGTGEERSSIDGIRSSLSSSSQLAESALSNLRKTLAVPRSGSPTPSQMQATSNPPSSASTSPPAAEATVPKPRPAGRLTLEDRLRAKFAIGDASNTTTPVVSSRASPSPVPVAEYPLTMTTAPTPDKDMPAMKGPLSPNSAPLPDSPLLSPSPTSTPLPDSPLLSPSDDNPSLAIGAVQAISVPFTASSQVSDGPESLAGGAQALTGTGDVNRVVSESQDYTSSAAEVSSAYASSEEAPVTTQATQEASSPVSASEESTPSSTNDPLIAHSSSFADPVSTPPEDPSLLTATEEHPNEVPHIADTDISVSSEALPSNDTSVSMDVDVPTYVPDDDARVEIVGPASLNVVETEAHPHTVPNGKAIDGVDVEALQKRLKLVEQRFTDVSTSFKRLQAEKLAADCVLRELTSVESVTEVEALRDFLQNLNFKTEMAQDEIRRLSGKLTRQDERIEELRDIHRLESTSQSDQIDKLKAQLEESEKLPNASYDSAAQAELEIAKQKAELDRLQNEVNNATNNAKEEEEKRTKAIALLKTVRQKLVKAEKERDDAMKEIGILKEAEKAEREKEKAERTRLHEEIDKTNAERETAVQGLRTQFDKEIAGLKVMQEKELLVLRGQFELEAITTKTTHVREIENKKTRISNLENSVKTLSREKDELFDQLQLRQAELESSQSTLESLQGQNTELQYQLREANDRVALLQEEFADARREQDIKVQSPGPSAEDVSRLLAAAESKYETKLDDLRRRLAEAERERDEGEAHWSKKLAERAREVDYLKATINSSQRSKEEESEGAQALKQQIEALQADIRSYQKQMSDLRAQLEIAAETEEAVKDQLAELSSKADDLQRLVDEGKNRESQVRTQNKTLREELRKVQLSVTLLEKQRGPGIGYWAARNESTSELRSPRSSIELATGSPSRPDTPTSANLGNSDEEVNFEYLRNVILQFLEHKEMRPHLVRILSTILRFTPQETRRLVAKV